MHALSHEWIKEARLGAPNRGYGACHMKCTWKYKPQSPTTGRAKSYTALHTVSSPILRAHTHTHLRQSNSGMGPGINP